MLRCSAAAAPALTFLVCVLRRPGHGKGLLALEWTAPDLQDVSLEHDVFEIGRASISVRLRLY